MIELRAISKKFGNTAAVSDLSLKVETGEHLVLLGTSGCGKTTTLKMINRLIEPDGGQVLINGTDVTQDQPEQLRRRIGYVMQNTGLFPHYTIAENIAVVPKLLKWPEERIGNRIGELLEKLHLPASCLNLYPHELSGGQQQRVGLARALVSDPDILLMDEPFGALDNVTRASIQEEFKGLDELKRKTIVMVTHDVQEAFELGDRICLMDKGRIVQIGAPKELLYKPANAFVKAFLDGQRLALEFKLVKLQDIQEYLPQHKSIQDAVPVEKDFSVWIAMELLSTSAVKQLKFGASDQESRIFDANDLSQAFNQFQQSGRYE